MKRIAALLMILGITVSLCACGAEEPVQVSENLVPLEPVEEVEVQDLEELLIASETDAAGRGGQEPPASATDVELDEELYALAESFVGQSAADMRTAIGEPLSVQYAASCLEEGAEDGMLFYPGFYVWTVRNGAEETVHKVYLDG